MIAICINNVNFLRRTMRLLRANQQILQLKTLTRTSFEIKASTRFPPSSIKDLSKFLTLLIKIKAKKTLY